MHSHPRLIGITGKAGAGKDTIARHLQSTARYVPVAFAAPLRAGLRAMFDLQDEQFAHPNKEAPLPRIGKSPRELMQTLGTEWGRQLVHPDLWLILARERIELFWSFGTGVVITDVRFENEAKFIREMGGVVWHAVRDQAGTPHQHASEAGVAFDPARDVQVKNNGSLGELYTAVNFALA